MSQTSDKRGNRKCEFCTYDWHPRDKCPSKNAKCHKCHRVGHFQKACRTGVKSVQHVDENDEEDKDPLFFLGVVESDVQNTNNLAPDIDDVEYEPPWQEVIYVNDKSAEFKVDNGADVCVVMEITFLATGVKLLLTKAKLDGINSRLTVKGQFIANVKSDIADERNIRIRMYVVKGATENLLSRSAAKKLEFKSRINMITCDRYEGTGLIETEPARFKVKQDSNIEPYSVKFPRRVAIPLLPSVIEEIRRMEQEDIFAPMNEASKWCAPIVSVVRPGRKRVRICVDHRKLNKSLVREKYPLPTLDDILHKLSKSRVFSRLDARSGYWQIPLDDASSVLTTFITPVG